jgi:hypothetical protein
MLSKDQLSEARREALEVLAEYSTAHGISLPAQVLIVSGIKSQAA